MASGCNLSRGLGDGTGVHGSLRMVSDPAERALHVDLVRLGFLLTGSREQAEDLAQDAFAALAGRDPVAADIIDTRAYLRRIVVNRSASYHRRRFRDRLRPVAREVVVVPPEVDETWAVVQRLSDAQRRVVVLRFYADCTLDEIASITDRPLGTVKSDLHRALDRLRKELS